MPYLTNDTYELEKLAHMFLPVFDHYTFQEILNHFSTSDLDLVQTAREKIAEHPDHYDLTQQRTDPWWATLQAQTQTSNITYHKDVKHILQTLAKDPILTTDQQNVFQHIAQEESPLSTIKGNAGTGKSFVTAQLIKALHDNHIKTLVLAPTHVSVTNLNQLIDVALNERFDQDQAANRLIKKQNNQLTLATLTSWTYRNSDVIEDIIKTNQNVKPEFNLILIDEAFATNSVALINVFVYAFATKTPVILIGDPNQLSAISNPSPELFKKLTDDGVLYNAPKLTQVQRTNQQTIVGLSNSILQGDMQAVSQFYQKPAPLSQTIPARLMAAQDFGGTYWLEDYLIETLLSQIKTDAFAGIILVPTNQVRTNLNNAAQNARIQTQAISDVNALTTPDKLKLCIGDVVMITETQNVTDYAHIALTNKASKIRLRGATRVVITDTNPKMTDGTPYNRFFKSNLQYQDNTYKIEIYSPDLDQTLIVDLFEKSSSGYNPGMYSPDIHELYHDLALGYAATVNKVQGLTIPHVQVYIDNYYPHLSRNLIYSGVTRAQETVSLISNPTVLQRALNKVENQ